MRKTLGPIVMIDTNPPTRRSIFNNNRQPYKRWDGNQATYLFFATFTTFLLVVLATLSHSVIKGLSVVDVDMHSSGKIQIGAWGWCVSGVSGFDTICARRAFSQGFEGTLLGLPDRIIPLASTSTILPKNYLVANAAMHIIACIFAWMTVTITLAASGDWDFKRPLGWTYTRIAYAGNAITMVFVLIAFALDVAQTPRFTSHATTARGVRPSVKPGPAVWLLLVAFLINLVVFCARVLWLRYMPRPEWSIKSTSGDFIINNVNNNQSNVHQSPLSAALPPADEMPPSWNSLGIKDQENLDEKENDKEHLEVATKWQSTEVDQTAAVDFTRPSNTATDPDVQL
ncbi:hypothetical protein BCR39DRAFT_304912 [Naematelia encephala]|uniref:SUR7/PalI family-domain-containing protein n=1 Tax=Naematelia encephala TaxID=71784 RepID=A0A1Y2BGA0_9TREE|nr:hypothetical protein BCR39DRAFT_304912 [Naematelia encephala]